MRTQANEHQSEFEVAKNAFLNDSRGANLTPYDKLPENQDTDHIPLSENPLLKLLFNRDTKASWRQEALLKFMLQKGAIVDACTIEGITPLMASVVKGQPHIAKVLLRYGADPNLATKENCTPLIKAADSCNNEIVKLLLEAGADPNARLKMKEPADCRCHEFASEGAFGSLEACHAPLTALAVATERGNYQVVETLLEHGADPNLTITHHAHGRLFTKRERKKKQDRLQRSSGYRSPSDSDSETEPESEQWKGYISVGTALSWARGDVRDLLLSRGASPKKEEEIRECQCVVEKKRAKRNVWGSDADEGSS